MKKIFLFTALIAFFAVSCKKSYTCACTTKTVITVPAFPPSYPGGTFSLPSETENKAYSEKMTKTQAKAACEHEKETLEATVKDAFAKNAVLSNFKYTISTDCYIK